MLEVEINQIAVDPPLLRLGCVVRYGKEGPVRFAQTSLDLRLVPWERIWATLATMSEADPDVIDDEMPLF